MAKHSKCDLCGAQSFEITPQVAETRLRIAALEAKLAKERDYIKQMDRVIDDEKIARSCISPLEDLKRAIAGLKADCARLREAVDSGGLPYIVQYRRRDQTAWINMAAFDVAPIAERYTKDCAESGKEHWEYRYIDVARREKT